MSDPKTDELSEIAEILHTVESARYVVRAEQMHNIRSNIAHFVK
jgi:hypothetical protein